MPHNPGLTPCSAPTSIPKSTLPLKAEPATLDAVIQDSIGSSPSIPEDIPIRPQIGKHKLMDPQGPFALDHPAIPLLRDYADNGCPADCGPAWTREHVITVLKRGPHISAKKTEAVKALRSETADKVKHGFAKVVRWGDIANNTPANLKISPIAMIPHKSRAFRAILDLSFSLRHKGQLLTSVNETSVRKAPPEAMIQLGQALKRLIHVLALHHDPAHPFLFSKIDIKDGFWRMAVSEDDAWNFAYVLPSLDPHLPLEDTELVVPDALQMGWCESPPFFCAGTETARDIIATLLESSQELPAHPLEALLMPPHPASPPLPPATPVTNLEVYVDDFFAATNNPSIANLCHCSRSLLHGIHAIFPPPAISGHPGEDPVSIKKLKQGDRLWSHQKEILG